MLPRRFLRLAATGLGLIAISWIASAKNYVRFANHGGPCDDLAAFLARAKL